MRWTGRNRVMVVTGLLLAGISAVAQVRVEPTGAVTGRVVCGDTNDPARAAKVHLETVRAASGEKKSTKGEVTAGSVEGVTLQTDLDGEFAFPKVPPGDYFVDVEMAGISRRGPCLRRRRWRIRRLRCSGWWGGR